MAHAALISRFIFSSQVQPQGSEVIVGRIVIICLALAYHLCTLFGSIFSEFDVR